MIDQDRDKIIQALSETLSDYADTIDDVRHGLEIIHDTADFILEKVEDRHREAVSIIMDTSKILLKCVGQYNQIVEEGDGFDIRQLGKAEEEDE